MRRLTRTVFVAPAVVILLALMSLAPPAGAEDNGVGQTPALGWSSWSFVRKHPTAGIIEAQARAMKSSGLAAVGYQYVNLDDFWYVCPAPAPRAAGPAVDGFGRWVTDANEFPPGPGGENGIKVVAAYVHSLGLKFGLYVTPGISKQAVARNTAIEGTPYHADDIATTYEEHNYNCHGMVGIDYSKPGAQDFIDSWAREFAGWGVDYVKLDGVNVDDRSDVAAWSRALQATGRPIHLELSNKLAISEAAFWARYSNGWRTGRDIECYCSPSNTSYPLTSWAKVQDRFNQVAAWQPYGGPGAFNDYDSIEVGNGDRDGLTLNERKTQMSLWALGSSPFILGTDLTHLTPVDLSLLRNTAVLAVDQDAIDARRIANGSTTQIFAKNESGDDAIVGLFNTGSAAQEIATTARAVGLPVRSSYVITDLWSGQTQATGATIAAEVPVHGVALFRVVAR